MAVLAAVLTAALQWAVQPAVDDPVAWILAYPALVLVALRSGLGPALLTAVLCALGATFTSPANGRPAVELPVLWGVFGTTGVLIALACAQSPRQRRPHAVTLARAEAPKIDTPLTRWLQAVVWGAVLVPLTLFASACWWGREEAIATGEERVSRMSAVTFQHAERSFGTAIDVIRKAGDLAAQPDERLRASSAEVRQRLQDIILGLSSVQAINVWDAEGRGIVSTMSGSPFGSTTVADRAYFIRARQGGDEIFLTDPLKGRMSGLTVVNAVARRTAPDGSFAGIVVVSLFPNHFQDFYQSLASEQSGVSVFALFSADGSVLARWPPPTEDQRIPPDSKLAVALRSGQTQGLVRLHSRFDGRARTISFRRLPELPVYASAALDESVMFESWHRFVILLAAVLGPLTFGLVYVSWLALKKTRREQIVLLELQAELQRRGQTEKALAQAQRLEALSVLTGGVAHDFNNLLAIVNGNLHMIRRHHPDVGAGRHLAAIARAAASGVRLTRQLLSFARRQALNPEQIVLQHWLPGMSDLLQSTVGPGIALHIHVATDVSPICVDAGELELALINLATNAKDAMDEHGTLRLDVVSVATGGADGGRVVIRVSDTGGGIAPPLLAKVFEPFFTTKAPSKGTGLGLSQVHGFCRQAGGDASVESEVGRGTAVTLSLPADGARAPTADEPGTGRPAERLSGRVLLVEDNPEVASTHRELLESSGLCVDVAASGEEALRRLEGGAASPDVVLSDIAMPGHVDGLQLAVRLKSSRPALPVLLMTGYAARLEDAQRLGCKVLGKPVEPDLLLAEVGQALRAETVSA